MIPGVLYAACLMYIKLNSKSCEALDFTTTRSLRGMAKL